LLAASTAKRAFVSLWISRDQQIGGDHVGRLWS